MARAHAIDNLTPSDQRLFVEFGFGEHQPPPFRCVHHAFEHHARTQPDAVAVEHTGQQITYAQLDRSANCLAAKLRDVGVVPGARVCLLAQRSIVMVVGILAILKAGGAYVPLDGSIVTQSTLDHVLQDSQCILTLALDQYRHRVQDINPVFSLNDVVIKDEETVCSKPTDLSSPGDSVYIIYTSGKCISFCLSEPDVNSIIDTGTTGKPKGVDVMHSNVTNRMEFHYF